MWANVKVVKIVPNWPRPNIDTGGEFSGSVAISVAAFVRQVESARESGFAELLAREQAVNPEFATSVNIDTGGEFSGSAVMSAAACVRQAKSARESGLWRDVGP
jgi:hypothetical protein